MGCKDTLIITDKEIEYAGITRKILAISIGISINSLNKKMLTPVSSGYRKWNLTQYQLAKQVIKRARDDFEKKLLGIRAVEYAG